MITLLEGDAAEVLKTLQEPYDFILWMRPRGSTSISLTMSCVYWQRVVFLCQIMYCRTEIS